MNALSRFDQAAAAYEVDINLCRMCAPAPVPELILQAALEHAAAGWAVFPCKPDKRPYTAHGFKDASTDPHQIRRWWEQWPNALIGSPMGNNGVFCVDLDRKEGGGDGIASWPELGVAPDTLTDETPSTGRHLFFRSNEEVRSVPLDRIAPGIEIKGNGGYIILPPSRLADGRSYYRILDGDIAEAPSWLLEKIKGAVVRSKPPAATTSSMPPPNAEEVSAALQVIPSDDYQKWFRVGAALWSCIRAGTFSAEEGRQLFHQWSSTSAKYREAECERGWQPLEQMTDIGVGTIFFLANEANPAWRGALPRKRAEQAYARADELAVLPKVEYEMSRLEEANQLGIRVSVLDEMVEARRPINSEGEKGQGTAIVLDKIEPWTESVDGEPLLENIIKAIGRHVALSEPQKLATALWVLHAHALEKAEHSPRLHISSPVKRCGKTVLLQTVALLVPRRLATENMSSAALFRLIEMHQPTLLIDEVDAFLKENEDMRGLINAGHARGGQVVRLVGDHHDPRTFSVWGALALAGIGEVHPTIEDRSITISLRRRRKDEAVERLRSNRDHLALLARQIARWVEDNLNRISEDPDLPEELHDRAQDNWRSMIAIADAISPAAGTKARECACNLEREAEEDADSDAGVRLLKDVFAIVAEPSVSERVALTAEYILGKLLAMTDSPWPEWKRGKPMTTHSLARLLKPFHIKSKQIKPDNKKGYKRDEVKEAYARYCTAHEGEVVEVQEGEEPF